MRMKSYAIALLSVAIAFSFKLLVAPLISPQPPFLLFFGAIMISAFYGGMRSGLLATMLSALVSNQFFLNGTLPMVNPWGQVLAVAMFIVEGAFVTRTIAALVSLQKKLRIGQESLRNSEIRFRNLVEQSPIGILIFSPDGFLKQANHAWETLWDTTVEQVQGYNLLTDPQAASLGVLPLIQRAFAGEAVHLPPVYYDPSINNLLGRSRWVETWLYPLKTEAGITQEVVMTVQDVSDRKQVEEALQIAYDDLEERVQRRTQELQQQIAERQRVEVALRESERRFRAIFNQTFQFIGLMQPDGILLEANQAALDFGGLTRSQVIDRPFWEAHWWQASPETRTQLQAAIAQAASGEFVRYQVDVLGAGDRVATIDFSINPVRNDSGEVVLLIPEGRDITEQKQAEQTLRSFFDSASMMMGVVELVGTEDILHIADNTTAAQFFGYTPADMANRRASEMGAPNPHIQMWVHHYQQAAQTQTPVRFEYTHPTPEGDRCLSVTVSAIPTRSPQPPRFAYIVEDISDRKQREAQIRQLNAELEQRVRDRTAELEEANRNLEQSEQRFRLVAESMPQIVWTALPDGSVDYYNQRWAEFSGISTQSGQGWGWQPVLHPEDAQLTIDAWKHAVETGELYECEHRIRRADGKFCWHLSRGLPLRDDNGLILKWFGTATDIQEQKQTQEDLWESRERFRQLAETIEDVFWLMDMRTQQVLYVNPAYEQIWGRSRSSLYTQPEDWMDAIHPDDRNRVRTVFHSQATLGGFDEIYRIVRPDGSQRWIRDRGFPIQDAAGKVYRVAGLAEDITERKRSEETLKRQSEELALANRLKDEFLATISHELRTPLNAMLGWTKLLPTRQFNPETTERALDAIARNTQSLAQLVEDVLDMSDIITGQLHLQTAPVSLALVIEQAIAAIHLAAEAKNIQITASYESSINVVLGDEGRLRQIVWNLLSNAVKFTPNGGKITVRLDRKENQAHVQVSDTGKGISTDFLPYVFDRFRQEDGSITRPYGGLGLGLAIVRYLVEQHGGTVEASSPGENQGATFMVRLPLVA